MNFLLEAPAKPANNALDSERSIPSILVVEDDPDIRHIYAEILTGTGYRVTVAQNGEAGWRALHLHRYDLLLTDNQMPRLSGIQLIRRLRMAGIDIPVILASGGLTADVLMNTAYLEIAALLPKPFTPDELISAVQEIQPLPYGRVEMGGMAVSESRIG